MGKALDNDFDVSEFELQSRFYVHFRTNAIKQRNQTKTVFLVGTSFSGIFEWFNRTSPTSFIISSCLQLPKIKKDDWVTHFLLLGFRENHTPTLDLHERHYSLSQFPPPLKRPIRDSAISKFSMHAQQNDSVGFRIREFILNTFYVVAA